MRSTIMRMLPLVEGLIVGSAGSHAGQAARLRACVAGVHGGHRFVRVAADMLLIAVGTAMAIDAVGGLGR
jgi:hypothetical protein